MFFVSRKKKGEDTALLLTRKAKQRGNARGNRQVPAASPVRVQ
jgi:hypothetical protein